MMRRWLCAAVWVRVGLALTTFASATVLVDARAGADPLADRVPPPTEAARDEAPRNLVGDGAEYPAYGLHQIGLDVRYLVSRPVHLDRKGILKIVGAAGTTGILYLLRNRIRDWTQDHRSQGGDHFLDSARTMGKGAFAPSLALIFYGLSFYTHDEREKESAVLLLESMAASGVGVGVGRFVLASDRPVMGTEVNYFRSNGHGFSGDAALAASVVNPLRCQYLRVQEGDTKGKRFWKRVATGALYTGAGLTAYQRVNKDRHWAPDAFLGLATGLSVGGALCDSHGKSRADSATWELAPARGGLDLTLRF